MAEAGEGRGKKSKKEREAAKKRREAGKGRANLISAVDHPVRRCFLRTLHDTSERRSPTEIATEHRLPLSTAAYHARILRGFGALRPAGERMARGAVEHFYLSTIENDPPLEALLEETREFDEEELAERTKPA
jgi:hypothetical protein